MENQTKIVNMSFVKAVVQNVSTNISEDLLFSLAPSQVKSSLPLVGGCGSISLRCIFQNSESPGLCLVPTKTYPSPVPLGSALPLC